MLDLNEVLVPVDFSPSSEQALAVTLTFVNGDEPTILVQHVLDVALVEFAVVHGYGTHEDVLRSMRHRAQRELAAMIARVNPTVEVKIVISEGVPFFEITRLAEDLDVDAIVLTKVGLRDRAQSLLFGSTTERVIRACSKPVLVLPIA